MPGYNNVPTTQSAAFFTATVTVADSIGVLQSKAATFTVSNTNRLPSIASQSSSEGQTISLDVHGTDNTGTNSLTYSASDLPAGLSINSSTGVIGGVVGFRNSSVGSTVAFNSTITLTDNHSGTDTTTFAVMVTGTNPLTASTASSSEGTSASIYTGLDTTGTDGLDLQRPVRCPLGSGMNGSTGLLAGIYGYNNATLGVATLTAMVTVADSLGVLQSQALTFSVTNTNRLPTIGEQADAVGQTVSLDVHGTDNTGTNSLTYSASALPAGLSINASTGIISGTATTTAATLGSYTTYSPTITLNDNHGGTDTRTATWLISNPSYSWAPAAWGF